MVSPFSCFYFFIFFDTNENKFIGKQHEGQEKNNTHSHKRPGLTEPLKEASIRLFLFFIFYFLT